MIYAISDLHGRYDKYRRLLEAIRFGPEDTLYVLGDVIDRGPEGFRILLDMTRRPNVTALLGNHEAMAIRALPSLLQDEEEELTDEAMEAVDLWFCNGGEHSLRDFLRLDADQMRQVWAYLTAMPLYRTLEVGNRSFVLLHGGLAGFSPSRPLEDYQPDEILWCRPQPDTVYYPDKFLIFGHTPTQLLRPRSRNAPARIFRSDTFIDIDCGCVFPGGRLGCLCLDTMEEIYA